MFYKLHIKAILLGLRSCVCVGQSYKIPDCVCLCVCVCVCVYVCHICMSATPVKSCIPSFSTLTFPVALVCVCVCVCVCEREKCEAS